MPGQRKKAGTDDVCPGLIQRVLVRHGIGHDKLELLADDIEREAKRLKAAEQGTSVAPQETGFHH